MKTDEQILTDILHAADEPAILVSRGRSRFDSDFEPRRSAERLIEIIGEAAGNLSLALRNRRADLPIREARAIRNIIAHDYAAASYDCLWQIAAEHVPQLADQLRNELSAIQQRIPPSSATPVTPIESRMPQEQLCGATTHSGDPCHHPLPPPGQECPAGHEYR